MGLTDIFKRKQQCIKEIELSAEAKVILDSPLVQDFFAKAEAAAYERWRATPDEAVDVRERLYALDGMLRNFKQYFIGFIANGQFAERQLEEIIKGEELQSKKH